MAAIIPTITMLWLAGENMFISDVKGKLNIYYRKTKRTLARFNCNSLYSKE